MAVLQVKQERNESESLFKWFQNRTMNANKNVILAVVGNPGSGKSYSCLRILEKQSQLLNRPVNINNCCRDLKEFINRINSGELKAGDVLVLEEVGVNASARQWQSLMNNLFNYLLQTFRNLNLIVLLNLPDIRMLDINAQRLLHGVISTKGVDLDNKITQISLKIRQHNFQNHKDYWKYLRVKIVKDKRIRKIKRFTLNKPSDELCTIYESRRNEFTRKLNKEILAKIDAFNKKKDEDKGKPKLTFRQQQIYDLNIDEQTNEQIAEQLRLSVHTIRNTLEAIKVKGYIIY